MLRKAIRTAVLNPLERALPERHRLAYETLMLRLKNGLEPEMLSLDALVEERRLALDVGANRGYYSYYLSRLFTRVEAFEPNPSVLSALRAHRAPNVAVHNVALSAEAGTMELYVPVVNGIKYTGWASFDRGNLPEATDFEVISVPVSPLDAYGFTGVSFVKVDVEGHEPSFLAGARDTLRASRPTVLIEVKERNRARVFDFFAELGYASFRLRGSTLVPAGRSDRDPEENLVFKPLR